MALLVELTCPDESAPVNGLVTSAGPYKHKMTMDYQCNNGYRLQGNDHRVCGPDSHWQGDIPMCVSKSVFFYYHLYQNK